MSNSINENGRQAFAGMLDDDVALKKAADFIGEVFIFTVGRDHRWSSPPRRHSSLSTAAPPLSLLRLQRLNRRSLLTAAWQVATGVVVYEVNANMKKETAKAAALEEKEQHLLTALTDLRTAADATVSALSSPALPVAAPDG